MKQINTNKVSISIINRKTGVYPVFLYLAVFVDIVAISAPINYEVFFYLFQKNLLE